MANRLIIVFMAILCSWPTVAQNPNEIDLESFVERLFQFQDEDIEYDDLYESLLQLYTNPINLNRATRADLEALYLFSPLQVNELMDHIAKNGKLVSIYELQTISAIDLLTIRNILPFVTVQEVEDGRPLWEKIRTEPNKYFILRNTRTLERAFGFEEGLFEGDANQLYGRFRVSHKRDYSFGFTFEKDAGERLNFHDGRNGFDYYSAHAMLENRGGFDQIILGDFQSQFGQGLVYGAGFSPGKGSETVQTTRRSTTGLKPYTSALESGFFRGAGLSKSFNKLKIDLLYSNLRQDANILSDTTYSDFDEFVNSIQTTGLHRTRSELASRNTISEQSVGAALQYQITRRFSAGVTSLYSSFSQPLRRRPNNYNQFEFVGDKNFVGSAYFDGYWQNFTFFGEVARSSSGGIGAVTGLQASLTSMVDFSLVHRNYARDFHSFYGNAFGESSRIINEAGTYWGLKIKPNKKHEIALYYDKFRFPWLRFRTEAPSDGFEYLGRYTFRPTRNITMFAQFRQENKERTIQPEGSNLNQLQTTRKRNGLIDATFKVNRNFSVKSRVQFSDFLLAGNTTRGFAILQDVNYAFWKIKLSGRIALIDTDDFENRQYFYERNVLYAFSNRSISGLGTRRYLLVQFKPDRKITFWARYAQTRFQDTETIISGEIGSGLNLIEGNTRSELTLQMMIKL